MSTIKISELGNLTTVQGNTIVPVVGNVAGTLTTLRSNVAQLQTYILGTVVTDLANLTASTTANAAVQSGAIADVTTAWQANATTQLSQIEGANAAIVTANTALKGYVDSQDTIISNSANAAIVTANTALKGYVDSQDTIISNSVTGANAAIVTANTALKGYVDSQDTIISNSVTGANAAIVTANTALKGYVDAANTIQSNEITAISNSVTGANTAIVTANTALKGYVDAANTIQSNEITAISNSVTGANAAIVTANTNMKGYVDANNATQLTSIDNITNGTTTFGNIIPSANVTYNLGSPTAQWKDLYLSGNTIYLGGAVMSYDGSSVIIDQPLAPFSLQVTGPSTFEGIDINQPSWGITGTGTASLYVGEPTSLWGEGALIVETNNIDGNGIVPSNDTVYSLGTSSFRWSTVYSQNVETESVSFSNGGIFSTTDEGGLSYVIVACNDSNATAIAAPSANVSILNYISINQTYANVFVHNANTAVSHTWQFTEDGDIKLPASGDILDSAGNSAITSFTMGNAAHWTTPVTTIAAALDQLAERIWNIENP